MLYFVISLQNLIRNVGKGLLTVCVLYLTQNVSIIPYQYYELNFARKFFQHNVDPKKSLNTFK